MGPDRLGHHGNFPESYGYLASPAPPHHALSGRLVPHQPGQGYVPIRATHPAEQGDLSIQTLVV